MKVLALLALIGASACDARTAPLHRRRDPGTLIVAEPRQPLTLDLGAATDSESIEIGELIFEGLVRWSSVSSAFIPGLATEWWVSPDGKRFTFRLRGGVRFHDGTPLDAAAVVFSFERLLDRDHPSYIAEGTYWRSMLSGVTEVTAVDRMTVAIVVERPYAPLLADLVMFPIVSPLAVTWRGRDFRRYPVGTGAFAFDSWRENEQVVVRRFDGYWGERPRLEQIVFRVVEDARQRLVELESDSVDLAAAILPDEQSFVELHPDLKLHQIQGNDVSYLALNTQRPPFDDVRVRRAINHGINKDPIVRLAYRGRAVAADGPLPVGQWAYHEPATRYPYNPGLARRLLAEAARDGKLDPDAVYDLYSLATPRPYVAQPERVARFIQAGLDQIGLRTRLVQQPYPDHRRSVADGVHHLALFGWVGDTGDPDNFLYVLFHSDRARVGQAQNIAFYRDAVTDQLLIDAQAAADLDTRKQLYRVIQDRIAEAAPWVPLAHSELVMAGRAELREVTLSPLGHPVYPLIYREAGD